MRFRTGVAFLLLIGLLVAACGQAAETETTASATTAAETTAAAEPIKLGFLYPFQGDNAIFGEWAQAGVNLRLKQAGNEFNGRPIEIVTANEDPIDPSATVLSARTLVERDGVDIIIGPAFSSSEEAVAPHAVEANVTHVILLTCPWEIAEFQHFICWPGTDIATTRNMGAYAYDELGYRKLASIGPDYVAGHNYVGGAADEFVAKGGEMVQQQWVPLDATDVGPYVGEVSTEAEGLLIWLLPSTETPFIEQYSSQEGVAPLLKLFDTNEPFTQQLGPLLEGTIGNNYWEASAPTAETEAFVEAWTAEYPDLGLPNIVQEGGWTMMDAILQVLETTGGNTEYEAFWPAFLDLEWNAPQGPSCFSENGMGLTTQYITQLETDEDGTYFWNTVQGYEYQADPRDTATCAGS